GRLEAWIADLQPQNDVEQTLVERAVTLTWQLERAARAEAARLSHIIRNEPDEAARRQEEEALALGQRLFFDRGGPLPLYPHGLYSVAGLHRVSDPERRDDPDAPPRLLLHLEATASGCRWLLDRWAELGRLLDRGQCWQSPDKLKAIRLLGHQPLDAADSDVVATIFLACEVLDPQTDHPVPRAEPVEPQTAQEAIRQLRALTRRAITMLGAEIAPQAAGPPPAEDGEGAGIEAAWQQCGGAFTELMGELTGEEAAAYRRRLEGRQVDRLRPKDPAAARAALRAIVDKATLRLEAKREVHEAHAALEAAETVDRLAFDASPEGERLRRFQLAGQRALLRTVDTLLKLRRQETMGPAGGEPAEPAGTGWAGDGLTEGGRGGCPTENPPIEPTIEGTAPSSAPADSPAALSEPRISSHDSRPSPLAIRPSPAALDTHGISPNEPGHEPRARCDSPLPRAAAAIGQAIDGQPHSTAPADPTAGNRVGAGAKAQPTSPHSELGPRAK
ncbi:MAG TPA: hypothetical protein VFF52_12950, partial [Isosphaeraceae bacterium]|nr:hypothetical protein [Isosphaeraceae bacterium]